MPDHDTVEARRLAFARAYVISTLGHEAARRVDAAMLERVFQLVAREEEIRVQHRDRWGNWDWPFSAAHREGMLYRPAVDEFLRTQLGFRGQAFSWPDRAPFAVCLSHDLDDLSAPMTLRRATHAMRDQLRGTGSALRRGWRVIRLAQQALPVRRTRMRGRELHEWFELEASHGFRSTVFVVAPKLARPHLWDVHYSPDDVIHRQKGTTTLRSILNEAADAGWDVGLHGSISSATTPGLLDNERQQIAEMVGRPVLSTRQHFLRFDVAVTPRLQAAAGLRTDSTLGFNRGIGFRSGAAFPHLLWDWNEQRLLDLLEVPQHVMDGALFTSNALEYSVEIAVSHVIELMDAVQRVGGCLTLSWHPNVNPLWWEVYTQVLTEAKRRGAWGCSVAQLAEFWRGSRLAATVP